MRRTLTIAFTGLGALALLAGCSSQPAQPSPDKQTQSSAATPSSPSSDTVKNPLDTSNVEKNPCSIIQVSQLKKFGVSSTKRDTDAAGPVCNFEPPHTDNAVLGVGTATNYGPYDAFLGHLRTKGDYFKEYTADGYRAVDSSFNKNDMRQGSCQTTVEVAESKYVDVNVTTGIDKDPYYSHMCDKTRAVARIAVDNLKNGS